jgi:glycosyltransferase involved in cell wall biosynthesis
MTTTWVVIPAFDEARSIAPVVTAVSTQPVDGIIVVDDGSSDGTEAIVRELMDGLGLTFLLLVHHRVNRGKGQALAAGIAQALLQHAGRIITLDADGQHEPNDIPRLMAVADSYPAAVIIAARTQARERAPALRRFANGVADFWISWACGRRIVDTQSGFRLYPAALVSSLATRPRRGQGFAYETELLIDIANAGAEVRSVPVETRYLDDARPSHYRPWRDTWSIVRLVGGRLLRRGMHPRGLLRVVADRSGSSTMPAEPLP